MNDLGSLLEEYLATRRALGDRLQLAEGLLRQFVAFAVRREAPFVRTDVALAWARQPRDAQPAQWASRLGMARRFARFAHAVDPRHEVPPAGLLAGSFRRARPYLYTDAEIAGLIRAARELSGASGLRPRTYAALLGLLAVTGMRPGEPLRLDRDDVDLAGGVLTVRDSKGRAFRHIPVHETTRQALQRYAAQRDRRRPGLLDPAFFLSERGARIPLGVFEQTFVKLSRQVGLRGPEDSRGPRLHDLRHRFAVQTLVRWHQAGIEVESRLPQLATYLGHARVSHTYWYLTATPELLQAAARRLDRDVARGRP